MKKFIMIGIQHLEL